MNEVVHLRSAIVGLLGFAAVEEELLLAAITGAPPENGSPQRWAALPLVAHNTEFKLQQVERLEAISQGRTPPSFGEIDHLSANVYRHYSQQSSWAVARESRRTFGALLAALEAISAEDLLDPSRHPWLQGRHLWLQIIVRGFWHPTGHLGDYYLSHERSDRALALQAHAVAVCDYLGAPDPACGMAHYNLACTQARADLGDAAMKTLARAIQLNPDLTANVARDADLDGLRADGRLEILLGSVGGSRHGRAPR
ncbi:MAG: hypothetical protein WAL04_17910 [Acidimicrobiales bacterium]